MPRLLILPPLLRGWFLGLEKLVGSLFTHGLRRGLKSYAPPGLRPRAHASSQPMSRTRVKICGVCRPEDAKLAVEAGADAIGMIFHPPSKWNISIEMAQRIVAAIGPFVTPVGVFVDAATEVIDKVVTQVGLHVVQLHGHEPPAQVAAAGAIGVKVLKALRVDDGLEAELEYWRGQKAVAGGALAGIVLETGGIAQAGGSGVANDFRAVLQHQEDGRFEDLPPLIIAGGLSVENVGQVVRMLRPWAVDVSSGVEQVVGEKSPERVRAFIAAARGAI
jgi:phosphoribosylanthranilate isomerase